MIPFASERGLGQDLATHLLNEYDNEDMVLAEVRGAVAQDLHGALAEWEFQAHARTRCKNYLFSLSVNPWEVTNGCLTREQYFDYIDRAEARLGLSGQPRAVVFHIKDGREHCHVVWSRIDTDKGKAVHLPFFKDTMMMVTREFAREHGQELPKGYEQHRDGKSKQLSLYEMHQQRAGGLSIEAHMEQVTDAWRMSDSPKAFVQALADRGYILAKGKRPYVLVDLYGHMNALPRLIDDKTVRTKDIRAFLEADFPPENLPTVEDAKKLAAAHSNALEADHDQEQKAEAIAHLKKAQNQRRQKVEQQQKGLRQRRHQERQALTEQQRTARDAQRSSYLSQTRAIRAERHAHHAHGLTALFERVSGIALARKKLHHYQDRRRYRAWLQERNRLRERQDRQRRELARRYQMQALDFDRKTRALNHIDKRELKSLEESLRREQRMAARGGRDTMPAFNFDLKHRGRPTAPHEAESRHKQRLTDEYDQAITRRIRPIDLDDHFTRAAEGEEDTGDTGDSSDGPHPRSKSRVERLRRQKAKRRDRDKDRGR